jgi:hypothetical protein
MARHGVHPLPQFGSNLIRTYTNSDAEDDSTMYVAIDFSIAIAPFWPYPDSIAKLRNIRNPVATDLKAQTGGQEPFGFPPATSFVRLLAAGVLQKLSQLRATGKLREQRLSCA